MNIYYSPEDFGLELIGSIEWVGEPYSFNLTLVLKRSRGEYFIASDSGCSCPTPFEDFSLSRGVEGPYNKTALAFNLNRLAELHSSDDDYGRSAVVLHKEVRDILDRIK